MSSTVRISIRLRTSEPSVESSHVKTGHDANSIAFEPTQRSQGSHGMVTSTATAEHADTAGPMEGTTGPQGTAQADAAGPTEGRRQQGPQRAEGSRAHKGQKAEDSRRTEQVHAEDAQRRTCQHRSTGEENGCG